MGMYYNSSEVTGDWDSDVAGTDKPGNPLTVSNANRLYVTGLSARVVVDAETDTIVITGRWQGRKPTQQRGQRRIRDRHSRRRRYRNCERERPRGCLRRTVRSLRAGQYDRDWCRHRHLRDRVQLPSPRVRELLRRKPNPEGIRCRSPTQKSNESNSS